MQDSALVGSFRKKPRCWTCNKIGHVQRFCPKRKTNTEHGAKVPEDEVKSDNVSKGEGAFPTSVKVPTGKWLVDSGASSHMTPTKEYFSEYHPFLTPKKVGLGDGRVVRAVGAGHIRMNMTFKMSSSKKPVMYDVLQWNLL